ncbi:MAG: hypothetical protein KME26_18865 [Oscillatoria princeps RMCB-10]|nr:hypothetical protein [Oscillatoria princeps RMCB-10]
MSSLVYRVTHLPDLEKTEYRARYGDDPASRLSEMQTNFLHALQALAHQCAPLTCSLVYAYNPGEPNQDRKLQIFVRLNFEATRECGPEEMRKIFQSSFWKDFYEIEEVTGGSVIDLSWVRFISFGLKQEERVEPTTPPRINKEGKSVSPSHYYLIQPVEPNEENALVGFCSKLEAYGNRALIEIAIQPTALTDTEQKALENLLRVLDSVTSYSYGEVERSPFSSKIKEYRTDPVAERTLDLFEDLREATQNRPLYEVSLRVLAENRFNASLLLNEFWVESSEQPLYREIGIGQNDPRFAGALQAVQQGVLFPEAIWAEYWGALPDSSKMLKLKRLHRLFTVEEVRSCFKAVIPDPVVVFSGIRKETDLKSENSRESVLLGWQAGKPKNQALVSRESLKKHVFICGVPGSGKTTAVLNLLFQLWTEHGIPFLVIEPAKTEYRSMLKCKYDEGALRLDKNPTTQAYIEARDVAGAIAKLQADLQIYSLGNERVCPFRFNPFAFYGSTTLDEHISTLEACFKGALPLYGPMPALLAEAIERVYAIFGWQPQDTAECGIRQKREFPNMQDLYEAITAILEAKQYSADIKSDLKTALEVRIGGLLRRSAGSMLNTRTSVPDIETLMERPVILEMDSLNEEQANLMTMFVLATLRQYTRVTRKSGSPLKHIVVIEEAHNIVGTDAKGGGEEGSSNPKAEAAKYIVRMLAEMRALGEGMIIADQLPSAVAPEVIKNTNVKLAHRTVSGDDREMLQQSMLLTGVQSEELARANPGDAYLFMEGTYKPVRIQEPNTKLIYGIEEPPSDRELVECIMEKGFYRVALAAKESLHRQKVSKSVGEVQNQLESLYKQCLPKLTNGHQLLEMSRSLKPDLKHLELFTKQLREFVPLLEKRIESTWTELECIWRETRQEGVCDAIQSEPAIQNGQNQLKKAQEELQQIKAACLRKINELELEKAQVLTQAFAKVEACFKSHSQQAERLAQVFQQGTAKGSVIEAYFNEIAETTDSFYNLSEELEAVETDPDDSLAATIQKQVVAMREQVQLTAKNLIAQLNSTQLNSKR